MDSLIQDGRVVNVITPQSLSSATSGDWISMENYDKVSFIIAAGAITTGGNVIVQEAKTAAGGSAQTLDFSKYHKRTASTDTYTETSANSASSHDCVTVGNSDDNLTWIIEVHADQLSDGYWFINIKTPAAFSAAIMTVIGIAHRARYAQASPPTALA